MVDDRWLVLARHTQPEKDVQVLLNQIRITLPSQPPPRIKAPRTPVFSTKKAMAPQEARNTTLSPIFNLLKIKGEDGAIGGGRLTAERGGNQAAPRPCSRKKKTPFLPARLAVLIDKSVNQRILIGGLRR